MHKVSESFLGEGIQLEEHEYYPSSQIMVSKVIIKIDFFKCFDKTVIGSVQLKPHCIAV